MALAECSSVTYIRRDGQMDQAMVTFVTVVTVTNSRVARKYTQKYQTPLILTSEPRRHID